MPVIQDVNLSIELKEGGMARVDVSYKVDYTINEAKAHATFREYIRLWGKDIGKDDALTVIADETVTASVMSPMTRSHHATVSRHTLNEDKAAGQRDEIIARVKLIPMDEDNFDPASADSNEIKAGF